MIQHTFTKNVSHVKLSTIELYAFTLKHMQHFLRSIQAANGIHGFQIHSSSYTCVCQVKCAINYKWCIQKL